MRPEPNGLTVVRGPNGAGKTSLLEAIGYTSTLRSFRNSPREALIRNGAPRAIVRMESEERGRRSLVEVEIVAGRRDHVQLNRQRTTRAEELLETLRVAVFTPDDLALVKGAPQGRRDYLDEVLVAAHPKLQPTVHAVERVLRQRATLLKQAGGRPDAHVLTTLDVWDDQLARAGGELVAAREALVSDLAPLADGAFSRLTGLASGLRLGYERSFGADLAEALARVRSEDLRRGVTTLGPHRDDLAIHYDDLDARTRLSQGRQRSVTLALRLAAHGVVTATSGSAPVLLLDDAFSELDDDTAAALLSELPEVQAILTTAGPIPAGASPAAVVELEGGALRR